MGDNPDGHVFIQEENLCRPSPTSLNIKLLFFLKKE